MKQLKHNIGDKIKCHLDLDQGVKGIRKARDEHIIEDFEIVGKHVNTNGIGAEYHYYLKPLNKNIDSDPRFGFELSKSYTTIIFCYEISSQIIGKNIIGCYEENILDIQSINVCEKCKQEIKERELFLTKYKGCWC